MTDSADFTMPVDVFNKHFKIVSFGTAASVLLFPVFGVSYFSSAFWWSIAALVVLASIAYFMVKRQVYVTLTHEGIVGHGNTGRQVFFKWSDDLLIEHKSVSGWAGIEILRKDGGVVTKMVHSVFVPKPVFMQEGFQNFVARHAPPTHPLRSVSKS
jgi:hypothetical protein